jgi:hypothetical protein
MVEDATVIETNYVKTAFVLKISDYPVSCATSSRVLKNH